MALLFKASDFSRSGFHASLSRAPNHRARSDAKILANVWSSFNESARTYGARRVWLDVIEAGFFYGLHKIERLMRANTLRARPGRRGLPKTWVIGRPLSPAISPIGNLRRCPPPAPQSKVGYRLNLYLNALGMAICLCCH